MQRMCGSCGQDPGTGAFCQHCGSRLADPSDLPSESDESRSAPPPQPAVTALSEGALPQPTVAGQQVAATRKRRSGCLVVVLAMLAVVAVGLFVAWRFIESRILPSIQGVQNVVDQLDTLTVVPGPPGPCYNLEVEGGLVTGWEEVACDGPRDVEAFFWAEFRDEPFPGDEYLAGAASHTCAEAFEVYVGTTVDRSQYDFDWLVPSPGTWEDGDRQAVCLVVSGTDSPLTGTVKGSEA